MRDDEGPTACIDDFVRKLNFIDRIHHFLQCFLKFLESLQLHMARVTTPLVLTFCGYHEFRQQKH